MSEAKLLAGWRLLHTSKHGYPKIEGIVMVREPSGAPDDEGDTKRITTSCVVAIEDESVVRTVSGSRYQLGVHGVSPELGTADWAQLAVDLQDPEKVATPEKIEASRRERRR